MNEGHFQHKLAVVESLSIGKGTRIWAFSHILSGAVIGEDCNICDHTFIENNVIVGNRVTIKCGVQLWDSTHVEDDVFIGPNVTFTNDKYARSRKYPKKYSGAYLKSGCTVGANSTILPGITVGKKAMIGAGSVVTHDIPPNAIVSGNPARIEGYINTDEQLASIPKDFATEINNQEYFSGVKLIGLQKESDLRGDLTVLEIEDQLTFRANRIFTMFHVPNKYVRGSYALKKSTRFLICQSGTVNVMFDNGNNRKTIVLDDPSKGLIIPPLIWSSFYKFSENAILLTIASSRYDKEDYVRDYDEFLKLQSD